MTICRKCGTSNKDDRKFCSFCNELLVADPVEMKKREKKMEKMTKKQQKKLKRQKRALMLLIPIGVLDLIDLILCLDMLFLGVVDMLGKWLGNIAADILGSIIYLFSFPVYTSDAVLVVARTLEFLTGFGCFVTASVLSIVMIVRMIKWYKYKKLHGDAIPSADQEAAAEQAEDDVAEPMTETVVPESESLQGEMDQAAFAAMQADREAYVMPIPTDKTDCKTLYSLLSAALWQYDAPSVRRLLSAMAGARLLLCDAGEIESGEVLPALYAAFGIKAEAGVAPENAGSLAELLLIKDQESGKVMPSAYAKALYAAQHSPENILLAGVAGLSAEQIDRVFGTLSGYFRLPEQGARVHLGGSEAFSTVLGGNVWMPAVLQESGVFGRLQGELAQSAATVRLNRSKNIAPDAQEEQQATLPSAAAFLAAVDEAEQQYFLSEELWRAMDEMEEMMLAEVGKRFANRTLRAFEKYTSVYIATGGKPAEALDSALVSLILPAYADEVRVLLAREEGESLVHMLERVVGRERLPLTMQVLDAAAQN